jgi:hypothetical protein
MPSSPGFVIGYEPHLLDLPGRLQCRLGAGDRRRCHGQRVPEWVHLFNRLSNPECLPEFKCRGRGRILTAVNAAGTALLLHLSWGKWTGQGIRHGDGRDWKCLPDRRHAVNGFSHDSQCV